MPLFDTLILAQANPAPEEATLGQGIAGLLVLSVMAASLAMIVIWVVRLGQTGHALPAARRGILRVPPALTYIGIGLSILMLILMSIILLEDSLLPPVAVAPAVQVGEALPDAKGQQNEAALPSAEPQTPAETDEVADNSPTETAPEGNQAAETDNTDNDKAPAAVADSGADEPADAEQPESQPDGQPGKDAAKKTSDMTPEQMREALFRTVILDLVLFAILGAVIFASSSFGRFCLETPRERSLPVRPGSQDEATFQFSDDRYSAPADPFQHANPYASPYDPRFGSLSNSMMPQMVPQDEALSTDTAEPFSLLTELRYAGEVFLAAYVPTAILKIIIILLTVGLLGDEPEQHPFLEMMKTGIGVELLTLILLTAVFLAPLVEELQFRVVMLGGIAQLGYPILGLTVSSILFAFAHGFPDSLALLPLAFALGYTYLRRRSYITVMMVHFLFNAFNMLLALLAML